MPSRAWLYIRINVKGIATSGLSETKTPGPEQRIADRPVADSVRSASVLRRLPGNPGAKCARHILIT